MSVDDLRRARPRHRLVRFSGWAFLALAGWAWLGSGLFKDPMFSERSARNVKRFVNDITPEPIRKGEAGWEALPDWAGGILKAQGWEAMGTTLAISVVAIILAALFAALFVPGASRTLSRPEPFIASGRRPPAWAAFGWRAVVFACRAVLVFTRSIPEYIWAFLLVGLLGINAWPAVLALALHNAGILGRLGAETVENAEPESLRTMRAAGAGRAQLLVFGIFPLIMPRLLVYFFYRWETCVREATVIGLLGISSLGFYITEARARLNYDEMLFFVLLGSMLVLIGDLLSAGVRRWARLAG